MQKVISLVILFLFASGALFGQNKTIQNFIPAGYVLLDSASGDLNRDSYRDLVLVLKKNREEDSVDVPRPLLLLLGSAAGYSLAGRNDNVVLCYSCGGVFGDPYQGITIKNGYFSIEHYGGSNWRWTRVIPSSTTPGKSSSGFTGMQAPLSTRQNRISRKKCFIIRSALEKHGLHSTFRTKPHAPLLSALPSELSLKPPTEKQQP
jgi:hypothetical protein